MKKSKVFCCVLKCNSTYKRVDHVSFHCFPKVNERKVYITNKYGEKECVDRRLAWILALGIGKAITPSMRVCSLHFDKNDFILPGVPSLRRSLKTTAVPTKKLPKTTTGQETVISKKISTAQRTFRGAKCRFNTPLRKQAVNIVPHSDDGARSEAAVTLLELRSFVPGLPILDTINYEMHSEPC